MSILITFYKSNQNVKIENRNNFIYLSDILELILIICLENNIIFESYDDNKYEIFSKILMKKSLSNLSKLINI